MSKMEMMQKLMEGDLPLECAEEFAKSFNSTKEMCNLNSLDYDGYRQLMKDYDNDYVKVFEFINKENKERLKAYKACIKIAEPQEDGTYVIKEFY